MPSKGERKVDYRDSRPSMYSGDHMNDNAYLPIDSNLRMDSSQPYVFSGVFRKASLIAASCTIVQAVVWIALSLLGFLATLNVIKHTESDTPTELFPAQLLKCFFFVEEDDIGSSESCCHTLLMPWLGTKVTTLIYLVISIFWLCVAAVFIHSLRRVNNLVPKLTIIWSATTITVCVVDLTVAILYGIDYHTMATAKSDSGIYICTGSLDLPAFLMSMAARGYILWLLNFIAAIWIVKASKDASDSHRPSNIYKNGIHSSPTTPRIPRVNLQSHSEKKLNGTLETNHSPHSNTLEGTTPKPSKNPLANALNAPSTTPDQLDGRTDQSSIPRSINDPRGAPQQTQNAPPPTPTSPLGPPPTHLGASPPRRHPSPNTGGGSPALRSALKKPSQPPPSPATPREPNDYSTIDQWRQQVQQTDNQWQQPNNANGGGQGSYYDNGGYRGDLTY